MWQLDVFHVCIFRKCIFIKMLYFIHRKSIKFSADSQTQIAESLNPNEMVMNKSFFLYIYVIKSKDWENILIKKSFKPDWQGSKYFFFQILKTSKITKITGSMLVKALRHRVSGF